MIEFSEMRGPNKIFGSFCEINEPNILFGPLISENSIVKPPLYQDWRQNHWAYLFSASVTSLTVQIWKTCSMSSSASLPIILTLLTQSPKNTWPFFKNFWYVRKPLEYIYTIFFLLLCSPEEKKNTIYISFRS